MLITGRRKALALVISWSIAGAMQAQPPKPIRRPPNNQLAIEGPDVIAARIDAPSAVSGIASQLVFHTSPLSSKGLLSQQVEDALKALDKANGSATFLKLRAFVSGTGDLRRVQGIVTNYFSDKKLPLPVVTAIQVGALTQENAQVVIESISEDKKPVNENGLAFFAAQPADSGEAAVLALQAAMASGGSTALRATCFADSRTEADAARAALQKSMPKAASVAIQATRYMRGSRAACEGIGHSGPKQKPKLIFTSAQLAAGDQPTDLRAVFDRLDRVLEPFGVNRSAAVQLEIYSVSSTAAESVGSMVGTTPHTTFWVEGLTSLDATLGVEAIIPAN